MGSRARTSAIAIASPRTMLRMPGAIRWCSPTRRSPARSTTRPPPRICSGSSRPERPSCCSSRCSCGCSRPVGRAAVIVPDGVLFGSSKAHKDLRRILVEENKLDAVIKLPSGVFRPYAGVSTAILVFTRTGVGGTDQVWFYDVRADGWSLDDKRQPLLPDDKLGPTPGAALTEAEAEKNNLPDVVRRWSGRASTERARPRTVQSFCVPKAEIAAAGYDLSLNRYKEVEHEEVAHESPAAILADLRRIEAEIAEGMQRLEEMVG